MAGELAAEWIKIPDGNGNLQKVWVRDSTARRDIAQLQADVGGLVIPDPSDVAPQMDGTATAGSSADYSRADHVHPHDTSKADVTAIPDPSDTAPQMDGTAAAGSSADYSRADHVHPVDTSRQAALSAVQLEAVNSGITSETVALLNGIVKTIVKNIGALTIGAGGYTNINNQRPVTPDGYTFVFAYLYNFGSVSTHDAPAVLGNGEYALGTGGASITQFTVMYVYVRTSMYSNS